MEEILSSKSEIQSASENANQRAKHYNPGLRALLSFRDKNVVLDLHNDELIKIENETNLLNKSALAFVETHGTTESIERWKNILNDINLLVISVNENLNSAREKVAQKNRTDSSGIWKQFDSDILQLKENYQKLDNLTKQIVPESDQILLQKDMVKIEDGFLPLVVSYAESCRVELQLIERYSVDELQKLTQIILDKIPAEFTALQAEEYEKDYLEALDDFQKELRKEKNLWDTLLDVLAGGTHQTPSERVMMKRWMDGDKGTL